jgi:hypothetical protein
MMPNAENNSSLAPLIANYFVQFRKKVGAGDTATSLAKPSSPLHGSRQCRHRDAHTAAAS